MTASKKSVPPGERSPQSKAPHPQESEADSYDETVEETFPASDPPSSSGITGPGRADEESEQK